MSRLVESDIDTIEAQFDNSEDLFISQTGHTMEEIAKKAVGITGYVEKKKAAVIPVTSGLGIIGGFSEAVGAILRHCQVETLVSDKTDVAGLQTAYQTNCKIAFLADDDVCAAFGIGSAVQSDNGYATGRGFASALIEAMKKRGVNPAGEQILIIGAGPVGTAAAQYVDEQLAIPVICDLEHKKAADFAATMERAVCMPTPPVLNQFAYIIDASTSADFITTADVTEETIIAAPGMPCGATTGAKEKATVIHNPLELGIMSMYFDCIKKFEE